LLTFPSTTGTRRVFSTAGINIPLINHRKLKKALKEKGFEVVGGFSCRSWDTNVWLAKIGGLNKGHPDEKDLERARRFAEEIKAKVRE